MESRTLTELLVALYRRLNGLEPDPDFVQAVQQLREDYDLEMDDKVPGWLTTAIAAVVDGIEISKGCFDDAGSDVDSFLLEVSELVPGWEHDDQGEWVDMRFPSLGRRVVVSREALSPAGTSCSSYTVERISGDE